MIVSDEAVMLFMLLIDQQGRERAIELALLAEIEPEYVSAMLDQIDPVMPPAGKYPEHVLVRDKRDGYQFYVQRGSDELDKNSEWWEIIG